VRGRLVLRVALVLALAGAAAWWLLGMGPLYRAGSREDAQRAQRSPVAEPRDGGSGGEDEAPGKPVCLSHVSRTCVDGNVWWVDGCGREEALAESCEGRRCRDGECPKVDARCRVAAVPQCFGSMVRGCVGGRFFEIDCAAEKKRCVTTDEGPVCREATAEDCEQDGAPPRCEKDMLVACVDGRVRAWDCGAQRGRCEDSVLGPRCVRDEPAPGEGPCGVCGCAPSHDQPETCDGRDNDGDGFVDEGAPCGTVTLVPLMVGEAPEELEQELVRLAEAFTRDDDWSLDFVFAEPVKLPESFSVVTDENLGELFHMVPPEFDAEVFTVPVYFVEELWVEGVPRPGLATPPNGMCGGVRRALDPQAPFGGVVLAMERWPTTMAHELGHYFGLCHTHQTGSDAVVSRDPGADAPCDEPCELDGDGICDTPLDPGPSTCAVSEDCGLQCAGPEVPDSTNLMSYYPTCRFRFSPEQARMMRRGVSLRRGWHACLGPQGCACDPLGRDSELAACPEEMTCRRMQDGDRTTWMCGLDGPSLPGATCRGAAECGRGSTCVLGPGDEGRCARPCGGSTEDCHCAEVPGVEVPLCREDLQVPSSRSVRTGDH